MHSLPRNQDLRRRRNAGTEYQHSGEDKNRAGGKFSAWFLFDDPQVIEWLGVSQYYKHALTVDGFDELFDKTPAEIKKIVSNLSNGQKSSVAFRARSKIKEGEIDSIKVINALEDALGVELIER